MKSVLVVLAFALMTGPAAARNDTYNSVSIMQPQQADTCAAWTARRRDNTAVVPEYWILGFLSGVAAANAPSMATLDPLMGEDRRLFGFGLITTATGGPWRRS
jgi:hypothetical protein